MVCLVGNIVLPKIRVLRRCWIDPALTRHGDDMQIRYPYTRIIQSAGERVSDTTRLYLRSELARERSEKSGVMLILAFVLQLNDRQILCEILESIRRSAEGLGPRSFYATSNETTDTDTRNTPTDNSNTRTLQTLVHVIPNIARPDIDGLLVATQHDLLEVSHADLHTGRRREALVGRVPRSLDGEADALAADHLDGASDVGGRRRHGDAGRGLGRRGHVVLDEAGVGEVERIDDLAAAGGHGGRNGLARVELSRIDEAFLEVDGDTFVQRCRPVEQEGQGDGEAGEEGKGNENASHLGSQKRPAEDEEG